MTLTRPRKPEWLNADTDASSPDEIVVRRVTSHCHGFCDKMLVTTLLDEKAFSDDDIATLYRRCWDVETNFRSLKSELNAGILSCRDKQAKHYPM